MDVDREDGAARGQLRRDEVSGLVRVVCVKVGGDAYKDKDIRSD